MTLALNGKRIDEARLPPINRATTNTIYVDSATGSDTAIGDIGTPLLTLAEAIARIPESYTGVNNIQCIGVGPYDLPATFPASGIDGILQIFGDRTSPLVTNASPNFTQVVGKEAQFEDGYFGGHAAWADGYAWAEVDFSALGSFVDRNAYAVMSTGAGSAVRIVNSSASAITSPVSVYEHITQLNVVTYSNGKSMASNLNGILFMGLTVSFQGTGLENNILQNLTFYGCKFEGPCTFVDCVLGGYYGAAGSTWRYYGASLTADSPLGARYLYADTAPTNFEWQGTFSLTGVIKRSIVIGDPVNMSIAGVDFELAGGICIDAHFSFGVGSSIYTELFASTVTGAATFIRAKNTNIQFNSSLGPVGSTSSTSVILSENATITNANSALSGNLVNSGTPGNEIQVGTGAPINAFADLPVTDATTLCRAD